MASPVIEDRSDMLTAAERAKADKWKDKHREKCPDADYKVVSSVSGYGVRLKVLCQTCGTREDVSEEAKRDPYPHR